MFIHLFGENALRRNRYRAGEALPLSYKRGSD